jgi:hypothetical protein
MPPHKGIPPHKRYPYMTGTKGRDALALNGTVQLPDEVPDASGSTTVVCRHLAMQYAETPKKADFFRAVASPQAIKATFDGELAVSHDRHRAFMDQTPESSKRLVSGSTLGVYLAEVVHALAAQLPPNEGEPRQAEILLNTLNHAMAIQVQRKVKAERGGEYFTVSLYDPNLTTNHRRVEASDADELKRLELSAFIPFHVVTGYAFGGTELYMAAYCRGADLKPGALPDSQTHPMQLGRQMSMAMAGNLSSAVQALLAGLATHRVADQTAILRGTTAQGVTALYLAMQNGHAAPVKAYTQAVLASDLNPRDKGDLLRGGTDEAPALYIAMQKDRAEAVSHFIRLVADAPQLDAGQKMDLLAGRRARGLCGIGIALLKNSADTVAAYCALILRSEALNTGQKLELLTAPDSHGRPALSTALDDEASAPDAIRAFCNEITRSSLSPAQKAKLLAPPAFRF